MLFIIKFIYYTISLLNIIFLFFKLIQNASSKEEEPVISSAWYSSKNKTQNKTQNFPPLQSQQDNAKTKSTTVSNTSMYVYMSVCVYIL